MTLHHRKKNIEIRFFLPTHLKRERGIDIERRYLK